MASYIATADGNLTDAATWGLVDATSLLYDVTAATTLTTSFVESAAFTPGAITIDGIAVYLTARVASPTGTITVRLATGGVLVPGTEVTINVSDVARVQTTTGTFNSQSLVFFKFAAPVLLIAATPYTVSLKTSSASQIDAQRNSTAGNWSRLLRTTTTGAPGAGDNMFVLGEWTAAATKTDRVVTMNSTAATDFGAGSTNLSLPALGVSKGGTVTSGTAAATAYILRLSGSARFWPHGHLNTGSVSTPVPSGSSLIIEFDCAADNDFALIFDGGNGVGWTGRGSPRTAGKPVVQCKLNTDEAAGQTVCGLDTDTGWLSGDGVYIASTSRTSTQSESRVLNGNAGASSMTVTVALTNAHSGTSPTQAEVVLATRNIIIRAVTAGQNTSVLCMADAVIDVEWVAFVNCGHSSRSGVECRTGPLGSASFRYCHWDQFKTRGFFAGQSTDYSNISVRDCTFATNIAASVTNAIQWAATTGSNNSMSNVTIPICDGNAGNQDGIQMDTVNVPLTSIRVAGCIGDGIEINTTASLGGWSDIHVHSNGQIGLVAGVDGLLTITGLYAWRNTSFGFSFTESGRLILDGGQVFGNTTRNINLPASADLLHMKSVTVAGDTTFSVTEGIQFSGTGTAIRVVLEGCSFGPTSGIFVAHTSEDIDFSSSKYVDLVLRNTVLASATELANSNVLAGRSAIHYQRIDGVTATAKTVYPLFGTVTYQTAVSRSGAPAAQLTPSGATIYGRLQGGVKRLPIDGAEQRSVSVYVRRSAAYTGSAPRLVLLSQSALGFSETVLATHPGTPDTWELLSGTTPIAAEDGVFEVLVDCDGSVGDVYVDDWN